MVNEKELIRLADKARENAYAPYSDYTVGAALLCSDNTVYTGCNIENASYPAGICGERTALFKAVSEGKRSFLMLALSAGKCGEQPQGYPSPCGICRQALIELCDANMTVLLAKSSDDYLKVTLGELLPHSFTAKDMPKQ